MSEIERLRREIEAIDDRLVDLVAERSRAVAAVWAIKDARGVPRLDPARERAEIDRMVARAVAQGLDGERVRALLAAIVGRTF